MTSLLKGILGNVGKMLTGDEGKNVNNWHPECYFIVERVGTVFVQVVWMAIICYQGFCQTEKFCTRK